jgi:drug/metabolite transporter (DMT)-like permease
VEPVGDRAARGYLVPLILVSAIWGASFLFIKVADRDLKPSVVMDLRMSIAALVLLPVLVIRSGRAALAELRSVSGRAAVLGVFNSAIPFTLIAWGETHVDSGVAAIGNSTTPIFVALLALPFLPSERASGSRLVGVGLGLVGVGVLAGASPGFGTWEVLGTLAVVLASFLYAASNIYLQPRFPSARELPLVTGAMVAGAVALAPLALVQAPSDLPGWKPAASVVALGIGGTAIGLLLYYRMLDQYGSARASLVTYLLPVTALFYGVGLLDEPLTAAELIGLVLILGGVGLGSGLVRSPRRAAAPAPLS